MKKKIALLLMAGGLFVTIFAGWQMWDSSQALENALHKAKAEVSDHKQSATQTGPFDPKKGESFGLITIPELNETLPLIEGTEDKQLKKGVGHYISSSFPGKNDQIVLSGHRDTVFSRLGELQKGDEVKLKMSYGTFTYVVSSTEIVDADDRTVIRSTAPEEELVLTTCYPFQFVGDAPERYIVYAEPKSATKPANLALSHGKS